MIVAGSAGLWVSRAAEKNDLTHLPGQRIVAAFQYPGVTLGPDDSISLDLLIKNRGRSDKTVLVEVTEKPKDWIVEIKRFRTSPTSAEVFP
jgi:hypothetical protein